MSGNKGRPLGQRGNYRQTLPDNDILTCVPSDFENPFNFYKLLAQATIDIIHWLQKQHLLFKAGNGYIYSLVTWNHPSYYLYFKHKDKEGWIHVTYQIRQTRLWQAYRAKICFPHAVFVVCFELVFDTYIFG